MTTPFAAARRRLTPRLKALVIVLRAAFRTHNAGVAGSSPAPAIHGPITNAWLARFLVRHCTSHCTHLEPFFGIERRG